MESNTTSALHQEDASPASYIESLTKLLSTLSDSPQKHRISLHPYVSTKSQAPHRKLFTERRTYLGESEEPTQQPDDAWLLGDLAYVTTDTENRPITCSLSNQYEVRSACGLRQFHRLLSDSCLSVFLTSSEEHLRNHVLYRDRRSTVQPTVTNGIYGLRKTMENIATGDRKLTGGCAGIIVCHYALNENPTSPGDNLLTHVSNVQDANVFVVYFLIKGSAGTGPSSKSKKSPKLPTTKSTTTQRCKYSSNMCVRLTMLVDREIVSRAFSEPTYHTAHSSLLRRKLGELQFVQRLTEEESWILFEALNTGTAADRGRSADIKYPLYLSYARDAVSIELVPKDTVLEVLIDGTLRRIVKREWFFPHYCRPSNATEDRVGLTQYLGMYTAEEQDKIDAQIVCMDLSFELYMLKSVIFAPEMRFSQLQQGYVIEWMCCTGDSDDAAEQATMDATTNLSPESQASPFEMQLAAHQNSPSAPHRIAPLITIAHPAQNTDLTASSYSRIRITYSRTDLMKVFQSMARFQQLYQDNHGIPREVLQFLDSAISPHIESSRMAAHRTFNASGLLRTKFFCEMNYLWTHEQLAEVGACWAHYTRRSILPIPAWIHQQFISRLCSANIIPSNFVKMVACNIYETGDLGLSSHFDDPIRFSPPIVSYQPFTEKRLSFGPVDSGMTNPLFCVSMPRGSILVMEKDSYAIGKVKHGVRKQDLTSKSGALIFRNIPESILVKAGEYTVEKTVEACQCSSHSTGHGTNIRVKRAPHTPLKRKKRDRSSPMTTATAPIGDGENSPPSLMKTPLRPVKKRKTNRS